VIEEVEGKRGKRTEALGMAADQGPVQRNGFAINGYKDQWGRKYIVHLKWSTQFCCCLVFIYFSFHFVMYAFSLPVKNKFLTPTWNSWARQWSGTIYTV